MNRKITFDFFEQRRMSLEGGIEIDPENGPRVLFSNLLDEVGFLRAMKLAGHSRFNSLDDHIEPKRLQRLLQPSRGVCIHVPRIAGDDHRVLSLGGALQCLTPLKSALQN